MAFLDNTGLERLWTHICAKFATKNEAKSDWNINDSGNTSYINNRPFYDGDLVQTTVVKNMTINTLGGFEYIDAWLVDNAQYTITWDGTTYSRTSTLLDGQPVIGNLSLADSSKANSGEPFFIGMTEQDKLIIMSNSETNHTLSIEGNLPKPMKLSGRYLPVPITVGVTEPPAWGTPGSVYIQYS